MTDERSAEILDRDKVFASPREIREACYIGRAALLEKLAREGTPPVVRNRPGAYVAYELADGPAEGEQLFRRVIKELPDNPVEYCPRCGRRLCSRFTNFCPNCGAKIKIQNEKEEKAP